MLSYQKVLTVGELVQTWYSLVTLSFCNRLLALLTMGG